MSERFNYPFKKEFGDEIGRGRDFTIRELGDNHVVKMVNLENESGIQKYLSSGEYIDLLRQDYARLKEIFGDNLVDTHFVQGHDSRTGDPIYYIVQKRIQGKTLEQIFKEDTSKKDFVRNNREQMIKLLWKNKKVILTFGVPVDFTPDNIMVEENTGKIVLIDTGSPTETTKNIFHNSDSEKRKHYAERAMKKINNAETYQSYLKLSDKEEKELDRRFEIDEKNYREKVEEIRNFAEIKQEYY